MNWEDAIDIYDSFDSYVDPLIYPRYADYSQAIVETYNYSVRNILKELVRENWDNAWDKVDPDGSLRDFLTE